MKSLFQSTRILNSDSHYIQFKYNIQIQTKYTNLSNYFIQITVQEHIQEIEKTHIFNQLVENCKTVTFKICAWSQNRKWTQVRAKIDRIHHSKKNDENDRVIDIVPIPVERLINNIRRMGDEFDGATSNTQKWSIQPRHLWPEYPKQASRTLQTQ